MPATRFNCPVEATLDVIGGKWKALILWRLQDQVVRFGDLKRMIPGVTQKMLTQQLRELEQDGLILRTVYAEVPPKVEYSMTEYGESLRPLLRLMCQWGVGHMEKMDVDPMRIAAE
ncbi:winged helix-turn-helix transcriptional regulator [Tumebacillus permanentifrigoris]|uniref:HxlR family transcriptional regulator n=1 Tax=Tumebacillus permanentifrigoris TaxID=378543 RepID=A0A316DBM4_9BACL|nr:helix-turn-helix domain-containing protein [Tumebacillus permanentifrigoris]PWK14482.1 HxlR family transcriptional regulator [Tumebacillus permanentifrigoris]